MKSGGNKRARGASDARRWPLSRRQTFIAGTVVAIVVVLGGGWYAWRVYANRSVDYAKALKVSPAYKAYTIGIQAASAGRSKEAEDAFERALKEDPSNALIYNALATLYIQEQETQKAMVTAETGITRAPGSPDLYYTLGLARYKSGQLDDAATSLQRAIELKPDFGDALLWLGNTYLLQAKVLAGTPDGGDPAKLQQAIDLLQRAVAADDSVAGYHAALAEALYQRRDLAPARASMERACTLDHKNAEYFASLGRICDQLDDLAAAQEAYRQATTLDPTNVEALYGLGVVYFKRQQDTEAIATLREALKKNPYYADAHEKLGQALIRAGQQDEGNGELQSAEECRTRDKTINDMRRASAMDPSNEQLANNLGIELARQGSFEEAMQAFSRALAANPKFIDAKYQMAGVMTQVGRLTDALQLFQQIDKEQPGYRDTNLYLSRINEKLGRAPEAERRKKMYEAQRQRAAQDSPQAATESRSR